MRKKLIRITTAPMALKYLLPGQMKFMHENGFDVIMISADGKDREGLERNEGCPHIVVPMTRRITPLQDIKCLWLLIKIIKKEKPDIVHTHTPKAGLLGMLASYFCGVKVRIHTVAGLPLMVEKGLKLQLLKSIEKMTFAAANHVWPNSNSLKSYIIEHKLAKLSKLEVILSGSTNGINLGRFKKPISNGVILEKVKESIFYSEQNIYLLFVGRMVADKGIKELVHAFSILQKKEEKLKLVLIGPMEKDLDPLPLHTIAEIKTNAAITHINWTDHTEYYMTLADYFVFPSHREGFPNVLLQAGAMQLPIVCSSIPGNVDIVTNNETGITFEVQKEQDLIDAVVRAIKDPCKSKQMAERLVDIISTRYDQNIIWRALLKKYNELVE